MPRSQWMRAIDSAQRKVLLEEPVSLTFSGLHRICFDIQGIQAEYQGGREKFAYPDMAERGIRMGDAPALKVWERLMRRAAPVGSMSILDEHRVQVVFWTSPSLDLIFDMHDADHAALWRECEIMMLSAGFKIIGLEDET